ncbi:ABC transporter G family member 20-like protein [Dinothrombium tinctorium]|uniref:ABC transporter G family member 20-like protein n=2 Tax=Dinothrombium tinctorium TaxID=1965070 RepID=A0A3S3P2B6_9ACAR|nr:ABC transporter G family member 20-like protein [Dinothrombium tinctorium]
MAVRIKNLTYSYGKGSRKVDALKNINLELDKGKISAFIGPSGCGKTTLVQCCVGYKAPRSGSIEVFGKFPRTKDCGVPGATVGYMPQEMALYTDFTINETFLFFGRLYGMSMSAIKKRSDELRQFLQLPNEFRLIATLSGGQQRRVSFAVALLHKPKLLVVDEPTVGLDPIMRHAIWNYFSLLTKDEGLTVIITTHYIEEARLADIVCLIREGELLEANNPQILMKKYHASSLESVFLNLCLSIDSNRNGIVETALSIDEINEVKKNFTKRFESQSNEATCSLIDHSDLGINDQKSKVDVAIEKSQKSDKHSSTSLKRIHAMCCKNIVRLRHNVAVLIFQFLTPAICIILFCTCFGRDPRHVSVAVHTADNGNLGDWFLQAIDNTSIKQMHFKTLDEAISELKAGNQWAVIEIEEGFTRAIKARFRYKGDIDRETFNKSNVKLFIDWTNQVIASHIQRTLFDAMLEFGKRCDRHYHNNKYEASQTIIDLQKPIYGERKQSLTEFMTPGNILVFLFFSAAASTALVFVMERKEGMLQRAIVAGVNPLEFLAAHLLQQVFILIGQIAIMLFFTFYVFEMPNNGSMITAVVLIILQGICGMSFGLFISAISQHENHSFVLIMGSLLPNFLMSGFVWPLETMPDIVKTIGWNLFDHLIVFKGFGITILWILVFQAIALIIFRSVNFN